MSIPAHAFTPSEYIYFTHDIFVAGATLKPCQIRFKIS